MDGSELFAGSYLGHDTGGRPVAALCGIRHAIHGRTLRSGSFRFHVSRRLILVTPISLAVYEVAQQSDLLVDWLKR